MGGPLCTLLGNWKLEWMGILGKDDLEREEELKTKLWIVFTF